jgi:hypothetical protein
MMGHLDSKYALVCGDCEKGPDVDRWGRILLSENLSLENAKPVSIAMQEIAAGKIDIQAPKGGIK